MALVPGLDRAGDVFLLRLGDGKNQWTPEWLEDLLACLDEVEKADGPTAVVTTAGGKYWSDGLDLEWLQAHPGETATLAELFHIVLARMMVFPALCVAAVQGHAFGAGAMLALAHDFRVMRADRGFWCLPEAELGLPFTDGTAALVQAKLSPAVAHRAMLTAHRYGGEEARSDGIVDSTAAEGDVLPAALALVDSFTHLPGANLGAIKLRMYEPVHAALLADSVRYR